MAKGGALLDHPPAQLPGARDSALQGSGQLVCRQPTDGLPWGEPLLQDFTRTQRVLSFIDLDEDMEGDDEFVPI